MNVAAKVRTEKDRHPERFCSDERCLWRVQHPGRPDTPCPKHQVRNPALARLGAFFGFGPKS